MHTRKLGPFTISSLGLGCMNYSMGYGPRPTEEYSYQLLNEALDSGYTFLDTAAMYGMGHSEEQIGKGLSHRRSEFTLASKCGIYKNAEGHTETNGRPEVLYKTCEDSLKRLKTDVIDLYYLHRIDPNIPVEESVGALARLVEQGKIRSVGLSEVSSDSLQRAHNEYPITALQSEYSLWSRTPERKVLDTCRELGVTFVAFSPLGRQFLTGKSTDVSTLGDDNFRATIARPRFEPENFAENAKLLVPFADIAEQVNCTMAQLSLAWLLAKGEDIIPIPGTSNIDHMLENAGAGDIQLPTEIVEQLDQLINDKTVKGERYSKALMESIDSERD
ncbi:aldo/keto reductase [Cocleimonas sp. KMM 6892]|uniref:aldo/keto reductase n=1 Tax=unclassified Cocleimonas TaxID=2639732 RepID=UPI002DB89A3D|nr:MULTISPECIES: aldo/keto reductase [unclassified Cocleimonas]MEB8433289.1 aldo/keto reductase [Cocleimonas sp. KMM 6892]MEC4717476.1 aldo/keto reductase [Cocleimonas sp. KMM 6895]MEC4745191.1 aldo/keto reductase [Cocleimonas sp. KMM 6896]